MKKNILLFSTLFLFFCSQSIAATIYFGEDTGWNAGGGSSTNSVNAQTSFLSNLTGVGVENFESYADGTTGPLAISFGAAGTATLSGNGDVEDDAGAGRAAVSGTKWWESSSGAFNVSFTNPIAAFGFFGTDFGDFSGQIVLTTSGGSSDSYNIPHTVGAPNGSLLYWGVIDTVNTFTGITFSNTGSGNDVFGFDDFTIGTIEQVNNQVPEPATMLLFGIGLLGVAGVSRRKQ